jgi:acyl carrier protein
MSTKPEEIMRGIEDVMRDLFDEYEGPVHAGLTAEDVEQWDSLANVQLMVRLEHFFKVRFTAAEITGLANVGDLAALIGRKAAG